MTNKKNLIIFFLLFLLAKSHAQVVRKNISLNANWETIADKKNIHAYDGFQSTDYKYSNWKNVNVPHNWINMKGINVSFMAISMVMPGIVKYSKAMKLKKEKSFFSILKG